MLRFTASQLTPETATAPGDRPANLTAQAAATADKPGLFGPTAEINPVRARTPYVATEPAELICQQTRTAALRYIHCATGNFFRHRNIETRGLKAVVMNIVEDAVDTPQILIHLASLRAYDGYTFSHSLNVCLLAVLIGVRMRLPEQQLAELAAGALLHDLGKTLVPPEILKKPGPLTVAEWQTIRRHGEEAFHILRRQWTLPVAAAHIARQHHENYDGSGYPCGLRGEEIHLYARIVAVADNFDAVTSNRPYRGAYQPHQACDVILGARGSKFDPHIVDIFLENMVIFPASATVALDSGEVAIVVSARPELATRPTVKIIGNRDGTLYAGAEHLIDLTAELSRFIVRVFRPGEAFLGSCLTGCQA